MLFERALSLAFGGLSAGFTYALIAAGLWLVWRYAGVANFAQSEVAMMAAFTAYTVAPLGGWPLALLAATAVAVGLSLILSGLTAGAAHGGIAATFAALLVLRGLAALIWGDQPARWSGPWQQPVWPGAPAGLTWLAAATAIIAVFAVGGLDVWLRRALAGVRLRAAVSQPVLAELTGVRAAGTRRIAWLVAGMLAVPAGLAAALSGLLEPGFMADWTLPAFALVLLVPGLAPTALLPAGLALGIVEHVLGRFAPPGVRDVLFFTVLALLIHWRARSAGEPA